MKQKLFFIFLFLVLISVSAVSAETCVPHITGNISFISIDMQNQVAENIQPYFRQYDYLIVKNLIITESLPGVCDFSDFSGIIIKIKQRDQNASKIIIDYDYITTDIKNHTLGLRLDAISLMDSNSRYPDLKYLTLSEREVNVSYFRRIPLTDINEYYLETYFIIEDEDGMIEWVGTSPLNILVNNASLNKNAMVVLSFTDANNYILNKKMLEATENSLEISQQALSVSIIGILLTFLLTSSSLRKLDDKQAFIDGAHNLFKTNKKHYKK